MRPAKHGRADVRMGEPVAYFLWGGGGITLTRLVDRPSISADLGCDIWGQPSVDLGGSGLTTTREGLGVALRLRVYHAMPIGGLPIGLVGELGYKTVGYLEGHPLDEAVRFMAGFTFEERQP